MEKKYNNWPADSKLNVPALKKGEIAHFRLLNTYNPKTKKYSLRTQLIASNATVSDPETNEVYEAAYVRNWKSNGDAQFGDIWFEPTMMCHVHLRWDSPDDQKKYQFMMISNENFSNPNRDVNITPLFEKVDADSDNISLRQLRKARREALDVVDSMSDEDISAYVRANSLIDTGSNESRRNQLEELAENEPQKFLDGAIVSGLGDLVLEVENLVTNKVIYYDRNQAIWFDANGKPVLKLQKSFHKDPKMELAKYLSKNEGALDDLRDQFEDIIVDRQKTVSGSPASDQKPIEKPKSFVAGKAKRPKPFAKKAEDPKE